MQHRFRRVRASGALSVLAAVGADVAGRGGIPNELIRQGVTKNTVAIGTVLGVEGYRTKDGTEKAVGRNFVLANGERLFLCRTANQVAGPR